jgi:iron only hydrogenase large subunit-like protein
LRLNIKRYWKKEGDKRYISSDCPAIVNYIRKYHPDLLDSLADIVSPMVAMSRVVRKKLGNDVKIVFLQVPVLLKRRSLQKLIRF